MAVKMTKAQARRLGIDPSPDAWDEVGPATGDAAPRGRRARRRRVPYHTVCADCGEHFSSEAAETRHLEDTRHANYQLVLTLDEENR